MGETAEKPIIAAPKLIVQNKQGWIMKWRNCLQLLYKAFKVKAPLTRQCTDDGQKKEKGGFTKMSAFTSLYQKLGKLTVGKTKDSLTAFSVHTKMMERWD